MKEAFKARGSGELCHVLRRWGRSAPPRLERRGRQKELERFCLRILLEFQNRNGLLEFPLRVAESENPDFVLTSPSCEKGIEVVEASDPREQAEWTAFEKKVQASGGDVIRHIDLMHPERRPKFRKLVQKTIISKAQKGSSGVDELLIYANTDWDDFEDLDWKKTALNGCGSLGSRFSQIWVISGGDVFSLQS
ncbi:hypothetical protein [Ruegeria arenilitoris]|uniref:hypothetical protein n=1 Tax=Ruegeria arenilitoris TaxID=1173585 RepID=UPI00147B5CDC|nr:hypothetical protein [Ruegeria arenilitoris]